MQNTSISLNYVDEDKIPEKFWARIDVAPPESETVSLEEVATIIDSIYDLDPCNSDNALSGGFPAMQIAQEDVEYVLKTAFSKIEYDPCKFDAGTYNYNATIYVYRSHIEIPYKLIINSGSVIITERVTKRIETLVKPEDGRVIETSYPIVGNVVCSETIKYYKGAVAVLEKEIEKNIKFSYDTAYDKVTVKVNGTEDNQKAVAVAFYNNLAYSAEIEPPEEDAEAVSNIGCKYTGPTQDQIDDAKKEEEEIEVCYQRYIYSNVCECSGDIQSSHSEVLQVPCPDSPATPHSDTEQGALNFWWQAKRINNYVSCPDEVWEGNTPEFYLENCCENYAFQVSLPKCEKLTRLWPGGVGIINGPEYYKAFTNERTILIPVPPEDGICGTIVTEYEVESKNCCDDEFLTPIEIDTDNSAVIIADGSIGTVFWEGGKAPYELSVRGSGFYFDRNFTKTDIVTDGTAINIYTEDACGIATFIVTDGCSEARHSLKSTNGSWVLIDSGASVTEQYKGTEGTYSRSDIYNRYYEAFVGKYRLTNRIQYSGGSSRGGWMPPDLPCMNYQYLCGYYFDAYIDGWYDNDFACLSFADYVPVSGYYNCYQNDWQVCYANLDSNCGGNFYQPDTCLRSAETRRKLYYEITQEEWQC
jgi:hypothetical protein